MKKIAIISDFSKTITSFDNPTSWSVFAKSGLLWKEYTKERDENHKKYHHFELEWNKEKTSERFKKHLELFVKYNLTTKLIKSVVSNEKYFKARKWLKIFFEGIENKNIELFIITSSWISNFIKEFLNFQNINIEKIKIIWNTLKIDNLWKIIWSENDIITTLNKWDFSSCLNDFEKIILLWDDESDLLMDKENKYLKIWFCEENEVSWYNIYLWKDWSLEEVLEFIK